MILATLMLCASCDVAVNELGPDGGEGVVDESEPPDLAGLPTAVATFQSVGVYWTGAPGASTTNTCAVAYRVKGTTTWQAGLSLWYDARDKQYRGSIVRLTPNTTYEVRLTLKNGGSSTVTVKTWNSSFPIKKTVALPVSSSSTLTITESGTPTGYILYTAAPGKTATIDVKKLQAHNIVIKAKYVIVRGLTLKGAKNSAIVIGAGEGVNDLDVSDVIIEKNDISAWGSNSAGDPRYGVNLQSGVYSYSTKARRIVVQRNRIHHPSTDSNSWKEKNNNTGSYHPQGPQGISLRKTQGNLVIRFNEIYSDANHYFNDSMGGTDNFSAVGTPNRDSDIHGNYISHCWDDGIEAEGANRNVRIWGNYITDVYIPMAVAATSAGPLYLFKNVSNVSRTSPVDGYSQGFLKYRTTGGWGGGRIYMFNNTALRPATGGQGVARFLSDTSSDLFDQIVTRNNIMAVQSPSKQYALHDGGMKTTNSFDYDLMYGKTLYRAGQEAHGIKAAPIYAAGWGLNAATKKGNFFLASNSPGLNKGVVLANFFPTFTGTGLDMGAHEAGTAPMEFGVNAYP
jgi:hypothetical protein